MPRASARHILVPTEARAKELKAEIDGGADFAAVAQKNSQCPSSQQGGDLGSFGPGEMVPEFDRVVFGDLPVGETSEPVKTEFGYHLIQVQNRMK
jgi:peptidyl-prolyl cis-trans isomerase C